MKKIGLAMGSLGLAMIVLVAVSSRHVGELFGYVKATADQTVDGIEENRREVSGYDATGTAADQRRVGGVVQRA